MEIAETGPVICLSQISDVRFAYGLANGTIGIYEEGIRLWRVKVNNIDTTLCKHKHLIQWKNTNYNQDYSNLFYGDEHGLCNWSKI